MSDSSVPRATKIVATLGPASSSPEVLERMIRAGVDVVRLNFSHGAAQDHIDRAALVREIAGRVGKQVAIMADLQGPKIRVGKFAGGKVMLVAGEKLILDAALTELGTSARVGLDYKELPRDVRPGDTLLLNDGLLRLIVDAVRGEEVHTTVVVGGELSGPAGLPRAERALRRSRAAGARRVARRPGRAQRHAACHPSPWPARPRPRSAGAAVSRLHPGPGRAWWAAR